MWKGERDTAPRARTPSQYLSGMPVSERERNIYIYIDSRGKNAASCGCVRVYSVRATAALVLYLYRAGGLPYRPDVGEGVNGKMCPFAENANDAMHITQRSCCARERERERETERRVAVISSESARGRMNKRGQRER